jgi:hypothetical protein
MGACAAASDAASSSVSSPRAASIRPVTTILRDLVIRRYVEPEPMVTLDNEQTP